MQLRIWYTNEVRNAGWSRRRRDNRESYIGAELWCKRHNKPECHTDSGYSDSGVEHNHFYYSRRSQHRLGDVDR